MNELLKGLKEVAEFLGKKIDSLRDRPQEVKVELNADQAWRDITAALAKGIELRLDYASLVEPLARIEELLAQEKPDDRPTHHAEMMQEVSNQTKLLSKILAKEEDTSEVKKLKTSIEGVTKAIKALELQVPEVDLSPVVDGLKEVSSGLSSVVKAVNENSPKDFSEHFNTLSTAIKSIKSYETVKINDNQIKALMSASRPITTNGGNLAARNMTVANVALTLADTQYSYTFPANTTRWQVNLRTQNVKLLYSFTTGKLPTSGDGLAYLTAPQNFIQSADNVDWGGKIIYLQSASASQTVEVLSFQL